MSVDQIRWGPWLDDIDRILESLNEVVDTIQTDPKDNEALETTKIELHSAKGLLDSVGFRTSTETIFELEEMVHQRENGFNSELVDMMAKARDKLEELTSIIRSKKPKTDEINEIDKTIGFESILVKFGKDYKLEIEIDAEKSLISARALSVLNSIKRFAIVNTSNPPEEDLFLDAKFDIFVVEITTRDDVTEIQEKVGKLPSVSNVGIEEVMEEVKTSQDILNQDISIKVNLSDIRAIENGLTVLSSHVEAIKSEISTTKGLQELAGINRSFELIQSDIRKMRKVPLDSITAGFPSMVTRLANQEGKNAELVIQGRFITLDRALANHLVDPITQILRNAVSHGIEDPVTRRKLKKSPFGQIVLSASTDRDKIIIRIKDDGSGIDHKALLKIAKSHDIDIPDNASDNQIQQLIFERGFSSKESGAKNLSGRGLGLFAAKERISQIGGVLRVESTKDKGTEFTIELSDSDALTKSLIFRVNDGRFAIPSNDVEHIQTVRMNAIEMETQTSGIMDYRDGVLPIAFLHTIIGEDQETNTDTDKQYILLICRGAQSMVGLLIDEILDERLINIKPLNPLLQSFNLFNGTLTGKNREVILVVNPASLM